MYIFSKFKCILKKRCQFSQVYSLSSLRLRPWIFRPRLLLSFCLSLSVSFCLPLFFSLFPRECDPFGVVATGVTLVGPPGGPRTDSRRATRTPEGVRSCARADVLLSFNTLDDAPVVLQIDYTVYSFARERNRMTKKHRILSLYSNVAIFIFFPIMFYIIHCFKTCITYIHQVQIRCIMYIYLQTKTKQFIFCLNNNK